MCEISHVHLQPFLLGRCILLFNKLIIIEIFFGSGGLCDKEKGKCFNLCYSSVTNFY